MAATAAPQRKRPQQAKAPPPPSTPTSRSEQTRKAVSWVTSATETIGAQPGGVTTTYGYDSRGRLVRITGPGVKNEITNVTHSPAGTAGRAAPAGRAAAPADAPGAAACRRPQPGGRSGWAGRYPRFGPFRRGSGAVVRPP
ncbi:hypothetical protein GCM10009735_42830 [Actinomadura chokoriensis]